VSHATYTVGQSFCSRIMVTNNFYQGVFVRLNVTTIRYDTIADRDRVTWTRRLSIQLYLAHVARKKINKKKKLIRTSAPLIQYRLIRSVKALMNKSDDGGKDL